MRIKAYKILTKSISRTLKTPPYLILFVTDNCWLKCGHCWFNDEWKSAKTTDNLLTFNEIEMISRSMSRIYFLSLTGGEAFLREDLTELAGLFIKNNKLGRLQIPTSGFKTELVLKKTSALLEKYKIPFRVDVSLDGNEEIHDVIRGRKGSYSNAIDTIKELNKLKNIHTNFDVGVITTISGFNQDIVEEISGIIEIIHPDGEWMVNIVRGKTRKMNFTNVNSENYSKISELINKRIKNGLYKGHSGHRTAKWLSAKNAVRRKVIENIIANKSTGGGCSAGSLGAVILHDGTVYPCEMYDYKFGNLREFNYNFRDLWNSKTADCIRDKIQEDLCICTQECFLSVNFLIQPGKWPGIIYERLKLMIH
jgi:MoaA/NifB/PqqE/SkfB family radical SAM enzyme